MFCQLGAKNNLLGSCTGTVGLHSTARHANHVGVLAAHQHAGLLRARLNPYPNPNPSPNPNPNQVLTIVFSVALFGDHLTPFRVAGLLICLLGIVSYQYLKYSEETSATAVQAAGPQPARPRAGAELATLCTARGTATAQRASVGGRESSLPLSSLNSQCVILIAPQLFAGAMVGTQPSPCPAHLSPHTYTHRRPFMLVQVLVLVIGDLHIPHRTADIPKKFKALLVPGKIQAATSFDPDPVTAGARAGYERGGACRHSLLTRRAARLHSISSAPATYVTSPPSTTSSHSAATCTWCASQPRRLMARTVRMPGKPGQALTACGVAWQVRGDFDDPIYLPGIVDSLPESKVVSVGSFKLGVCHGHQIVPWGDAESLGAPHPPPRPERRYRMTTTCGLPG